MDDITTITGFLSYIPLPSIEVDNYTKMFLLNKHAVGSSWVAKSYNAVGRLDRCCRIVRSGLI